ncbi:MAG: hypothetical protein JSR46_02650 [Verrucomicrobia bacterium]|nr:hypothetical protein [Verrucomicrobiota bacterium]
MSNPYDGKTIQTIIVSSVLTMIAGYYLVPGAATLTTAIWLGVGNAVIEALAVYLINEFTS